MTSEQGKILMGAWDCDACGAKGVPGDVYECPSCGEPRPRDVKFYLPANSPEITDKTGIEGALAGPDWLCSSCGYYNAAIGESSKFCKGCGAPRGADSVEQEVGNFVPTYQIPHSTAEVEQVESNRRIPGRPSPARSLGSKPISTVPSQSKTGGKWLPWLAISLVAGLVLAIVLSGYLLFFQTHDVQASVSGFSWSRSTDVEVYGTVRESDWSIPSGGRQVSTDWRIRSYVQKLDHYETRTRQVPHTEYRTVSESCSRSLGNGRFESSTCSHSESYITYTTESYQEPVYRQDPVYDTWYTYDIDKWHVDHTAHLEGKDHAPSWPTIEVTKTQREGKKTERYTVYFVAKDKTYHKDVSWDEWQAMRSGQGATLSLNRQDDVRAYKLSS